MRSIEERAFNAWPALQTVLSDGWVLRFADGYTKRANSANALAPTEPFAATLHSAEALYAAQRLPLIFRLSPLAGTEPDAILGGLGFRRIDETLVMTARVAPCPPSNACVSIRSTPDETWSTGFADANSIPPIMRRTHDAMLAAIRLPTAYATLTENSRPVAYGLAVAEREMVGLFDIVTLPSARRRGAGQRIVASLLAWGRSNGATEAYLQVVATNTPAITLYTKLGFQEVYRYHYRVRP